jgi:AraC-like DNA-binding protein/GGDEF domain-containing protein
MIVIIFPVVFLSVMSYRTVVGMLQEELSEAERNSLQQINVSVSNLLSGLTALSVRLGFDGKLYAYTYAKSGNANYDINEVRDSLQTLAGENAYVYSVEVYYKSDSLIIPSTGLPHTYRHGPEEEWISQMERSDRDYLWLIPREIRTPDGAGKKVITLATKLPLTDTNKYGYAAVNIDEEKIRLLLQQMGSSLNRNVYIADASGAIVTSYVNESRIRPSYWMERMLASKGSDYFIDAGHDPHSIVSFTQPLQNGWMLVYATPLSFLYNKLVYFRNVIILTGIVLFALGIVVAYLLSRTMYNPIRQLMTKLRSYQAEFAIDAADAGKSDFTYLSNMFDNVALKHREMDKYVQQNAPTLIERFVQGLLYHKLTDGAEIRSKLEQLGLDFGLEHCAVMIVEIDDYSALRDRFSAWEMDLYAYAVSNISGEIIAERHCRALTTAIRDNQSAILVNLDGKDGEAKAVLQEAAERIGAAVRQYLHFSVTVSIGGVYDDIAQVHLSFNEAQDVMREKLILGKNKVLVYDELIHNRDVDYYYPVLLEKSILNNLRAGNEEQTLQLLDQMKREMSEKRDISYENIYRLYDRLLASALDLVIEKKGSLKDVFADNYPVHQELAKQETIDSITDWLGTVFGKIIDDFAKLESNNTNVQQAIDYLQANFHSDISMDDVAEQVNLNPAYLSRIFKQNTGKTMVDYLARLRIEESKKLLADSRLSIQEIAQRVGYVNTNSYIRLFKKHEGVTPGEFRKSESI